MTAPLHVVVPDDVTIAKGETVTFMVNGGGHGLAIYPVSQHTTRADIIDGLCDTWAWLWVAGIAGSVLGEGSQRRCDY